jgi:hypothetical protein
MPPSRRKDLGDDGLSNQPRSGTSKMTYHHLHQSEEVHVKPDAEPFRCHGRGELRYCLSHVVHGSP